MTVAKSDLYALSRRGFLASAFGAATVPLLGPVRLEAAQGDNRFIAISLRGALDGLDLVQPYGDPAFADLRPDLALSPDDRLIDLDGFFGLHPAAAPLMPLWQGGELAFVHATATPYRGGTSHFDGQDVLDAGSLDGRALKSGWLNRSLSLIPRAGSRKTLDIGMSMGSLLNGPGEVDLWSPAMPLPLAEDELRFLGALYASDEGFRSALLETGDAGPAGGILDPAGRRAGLADIVTQIGTQLRGDYRIASLSLSGWDTHADQATQFDTAAGDLAAVLTGLKLSLGDAWGSTVVLVQTEFGRTVRQNATRGTDHGTASVTIIAGGGLAGGRMLGTWPGLGAGQLLDDRDLMPTTDAREIAAAMLHRQFDITPANLSAKVFPGLSFDQTSAFLKV
ncbi:DUF1501 domain-containing protein [Rhizobium sp. 0TCS1.26]|uniref:DUF1501 domain-containing protein n=1 Tax=Rhizobium sp. 0TCS1.26 TaxID=3142623 RepID=UPI003D2E3B09